MNNKKQLFKKCKICGLQSDDMSLYCRTLNKLKSGENSISYKNRCNACNWKEFKKNPSKDYKGKVDFIKTIKETTPCYDCGVNYPYYMMDFDHIYNNKSFTIASHSGKTLQNVKDEAKKCQIVCSNCHRKRTHFRRLNKV